MIIGLVGKPSVGKSTFFKAATLAEVDIASYPFTTIKPNEGVAFVKVKDPAIDFGKQSNPREGFVVGEERFVPVKLLDVAGLVPGAHSGEGMGNQFLDDLRQADVLIHVIDISGSTNEKGEPVDTGSYDPANDVRFLEEELDHWYAGILQKGWERFARQVQQEKGKIADGLAKQLSGLKVTLPLVEDAIKALSLNVEKPAEWTEEELFSLAQYLRKETKKMVIACNKIDVAGSVERFNALQSQFHDILFVACSADSEVALREAAKHELIAYVPGEKAFSITEKGKEQLNEKQQQALQYIQEHVMEQGTGVQEALNAAVFSLLGYIAVYPGGVGKLEDKDGNTLPDCFLLPGGSTALDFAYALHTDFGDHFIRAVDVRTKKTVGKEHVLQDSDILEIVSGK